MEQNNINDFIKNIDLSQPFPDTEDFARTLYFQIHSTNKDLKVMFNQNVGFSIKSRISKCIEANILLLKDLRYKYYIISPEE